MAGHALKRYTPSHSSPSKAESARQSEAALFPLLRCTAKGERQRRKVFLFEVLIEDIAIAAAVSSLKSLISA